MSLTIQRQLGIRFIVAFATVFALLHGVLSLNDKVRSVVIDSATVAVTAQLLTVVYPHDHVSAMERSIGSERVHMNVLRGCEGLEAMTLLIAAIAAFPAPWSTRVKSMVVGCAAAYCLNQLRIIALYATLRDAPRWFELMHGYVAPSFTIILIVLGFSAWAVRQVAPLAR